jgi:hypothetical protein
VFCSGSTTTIADDDRIHAVPRPDNSVLYGPLFR